MYMLTLCLIDGHVGYVHPFVIMSSEAMNIHVQVIFFFLVTVFHFWSPYHRVELLAVS